MINHARTLLLNRARQKTHYSDIGYEYVPPAFKPLILPPTLNLIWQSLFGADPDNYFLNYRCREILSYIHSTELREYIYALDPRVTYWPEIGRPFFEPTSKRVAITQVYGFPAQFTVTGDLKSLNATGNAHNQYTIDLYKKIDENDEPFLEMRLQQIGRGTSAIVAIVRSLDSPPIITLPQTDVKLRLTMRAPILGPSLLLNERKEQLQIEDNTPLVRNNIAAEPAMIRQIKTETDAITFIEAYAAVRDGQIPDEPTTGLVCRWFIETKATPSPIMTTAIPTLEMLGEPATLELFGLENDEPYLTFKNLWFDHTLPVYRLSGIVLALIYRIEELRKQWHQNR